MSAYIDKDNHIIISADDARGGVTGHNVRYVLEFGLAGTVASFLAIVIYANFDRISERLTTAFSQGFDGFLVALAPYAAVVVVSLLCIGLLLKIWSLLAGPTENGSQRFMRARVVSQFVIIAALMVVTLNGGL